MMVNLEARGFLGRVASASGFKRFSLQDAAVEHGTPFYLYDLDNIEERLTELNHSERPLKLFFAMKSNNHPAVLKLMAKHGVGADVVSLGEFKRAVEWGIGAQQIVFSGVGKADIEIDTALSLGLGHMHVESLSELERVIHISRKLNKTTSIGLRFNPDVEPKTHPYICTGLRENKFGLERSGFLEAVALARKNDDSVRLCGVAIHIGSQIRELSVFTEAFNKTWSLMNELGHQGLELDYVDLGGGLGIDYLNQSSPTEFKEYTRRVVESFKAFTGEIWLEPGRCLVAQSGVLVTRILHVKRTPWKSFVVVDTGMHHLLRPALYQAHHHMEILKGSGGDNFSGRPSLFDIVGPICETSDILGKDRLLTDPQRGELLVIHDVGAYGSTMGSFYNLHPWPVEIAVGSDGVSVLKRRLSEEFVSQM